MVGLTPEAWYHLNEGADADVIDETVNNHDGTAEGAYSWVTAKLGASAISLDNGAFVNFGDIFDFEYDDLFTIEFWLKFEDNTGGGVEIFRSDVSVNNFRGWKLFIDASSNVLELNINEITPGQELQISFDLAQWDLSVYNHFGITYDGTSAATGLHLYINGVEKIFTTVVDNLQGNTIISAGRNFLWLQEGASTKQAILDELAVYTTALPIADMLARYQAGLGNESMTETTWDISTLSNIVRMEVNDMTLDEGIPFMKLEVVDNVVPADWYIAFTGPYYFAGANVDEIFFKGIVDDAKTRRDDATGSRTFHLDHWLKSDLDVKPTGVIGTTADTYEDILEDIIALATIINMLDNGNISGSTTTDAMTLTANRKFHSIIKQGCEADKHVAFLHNNDGDLYKEVPTTSSGLTWSDTVGGTDSKGCRWMGSKPAGPRPNQVNATGLSGATSQKNATDTTFQDKYGVIPVYRFKPLEQAQLDLWAQRYIDNLSADNYIINLQLYTGYHLAPGQTVLFSSAQMVVSQDTYLIKMVRYNALTGEILKVKISLGVGFKPQGKLTERIDENTEFTEDVRAKVASENIIDLDIIGLNGFVEFSNYGKCFVVLNTDADAVVIGSATIRKAGNYDVYMKFMDKGTPGTIDGAISYVQKVDDEAYAGWDVAAQNNDIAFATAADLYFVKILDSWVIAADNTHVSVAWAKTDSHPGGDYIYIYGLFIVPEDTW